MGQSFDCLRSGSSAVRAPEFDRVLRYGGEEQAVVERDDPARRRAELIAGPQIHGKLSTRLGSIGLPQLPSRRGRKGRKIELTAQLRSTRLRTTPAAQQGKVRITSPGRQMLAGSI